MAASLMSRLLPLLPIFTSASLDIDLSNLPEGMNLPSMADIQAEMDRMDPDTQEKLGSVAEQMMAQLAQVDFDGLIERISEMSGNETLSAAERKNLIKDAKSGGKKKSKKSKKKKGASDKSQFDAIIEKGRAYWNLTKFRAMMLLMQVKTYVKKSSAFKWVQKNPNMVLASLIPLTSLIGFIAGLRIQGGDKPKQPANDKKHEAKSD
jgi:hypothetical protein